MEFDMFFFFLNSLFKLRIGETQDTRQAIQSPAGSKAFQYRPRPYCMAGSCNCRRDFPAVLEPEALSVQKHCSVGKDFVHADPRHADAPIVAPTIVAARRARHVFAQSALALRIADELGQC
jgi:hypothetical protein